MVAQLFHLPLFVKDNHKNKDDDNDETTTMKKTTTETVNEKQSAGLRLMSGVMNVFLHPLTFCPNPTF